MGKRGQHPSLAQVVVAAGCVLALSGGAAAATDLTAEAHRIAKVQTERFGEGYTARVDLQRHIVYVSALDDRHLEQTVQRLAAFAEAYRRTMPASRPAWNITVILPTVEDYRKLDLPHERCAGFYSPAGRRLVSIDRGRTLFHEFTHALHHADIAAAKQVHPPWVCEGLATLFEASTITPSGLKPGIDARLPALQRALKANRAIGLEPLLKMGHKAFMQQAELAYPSARYVMLYLHQRGRLRAWYQRYKAAFRRDPHGIRTFEEALGNRLFLLERDWQKWVLSLRMPANERRLRQGRLGLEVKSTAQGVEVAAVLPGSAAQRAGRIRVGDLVEEFNGHSVRTPADLVGAIRAARALQTVKVQLVRSGRRMTVIQPLGAPSAR